MEEEKIKRKRKRSRKKKSKSLSIEAVELESKNVKSNETNLIPVHHDHDHKKAKNSELKNGHEESTYQKKELKNKSKRRKKRMRKSSTLPVESPDLKYNSKHYLHGKNNGKDKLMTAAMIKTDSDVNIKQDSVAFIEQLPNKQSNTSTQKASFKQKLQNRLESGRFRWINEQLYTKNSLCAFKMFKAEPALFDVYHQGFSGQVQKWPVNPVDTMIKWIMERSPHLIIADMGCGEAKISQSVPNKVFSFDLVANNSFVTVCDMAKVPLTDESVDIVIYCLSLMGTNLNDFLKEARRILKSNGVLKIAEVVSRFESLSSFEETVCSLGYALLTKDTANKMFVQFEFKKLSKKADKTKTLPLSLKPCLYKRR